MATESSRRSLPSITWGRIIQEVRAATAPRKPRSIKVGSTDAEIATELRIRQTPRFFGLIPEQAALLGQFFPRAMQATLARADRIMALRFDLPGVPNHQFKSQVDWHADIASGYHWPMEHVTRLALENLPEGVNPRGPWTLSRFYHTVRLGQAYLYTMDDRYAQVAVSQMTDWIRSNPVNFGVNWLSGREVAIRAVNWVWTYYCILESDTLTKDFLTTWIASLREHGTYLHRAVSEGDLEGPDLLAALCGLAYLGVIFPEFNDASRWRSSSLNRFWGELEGQVNPDGFYYAGSTAMHRFALELGLALGALYVVNGIDIPEQGRARLGSMLDVLMAYLRPDGTVPAIGDDRGERLLILTDGPNQSAYLKDHRHLLGLASLVLERQLNEWAGFVDPGQRGWSVAAGNAWQDAFWYFASDSAARFTDVLTHITRRPENVPPDAWIEVTQGVRVRARALTTSPISLADIQSSRGYEASGLYVMQAEDLQMTVNTGSGLRYQHGTYAHKDLLSLTLWAYGKPMLVDPGTYHHHEKRDIHQAFRVTAAHNTLQIGSREVIPDAANGSHAHGTVHRWVSTAGFDLLDVSHGGYSKGNPPVHHRRVVWFDRLAELWLIYDFLSVADPDKAEHDPEVPISLWFHLAPGAAHIDRPARSVVTDNEKSANLVIMPIGVVRLIPEIQEGWMAPVYGTRMKAPVARFYGESRLPVDMVTLIYPHQAVSTDLGILRSNARSSLARLEKQLADAGRTR